MKTVYTVFVIIALLLVSTTAYAGTEDLCSSCNIEIEIDFEIDLNLQALEDRFDALLEAKTNSITEGLMALERKTLFAPPEALKRDTYPVRERKDIQRLDI